MRVTMNESPLPLRNLFEASLELAPPARAAYLDAHCVEPHVRRLLDSMLAADADADKRLLDHSFDAIYEQIGDIDTANASMPTTVGPFVVREKLGEAGGYVRQGRKNALSVARKEMWPRERGHLARATPRLVEAASKAWFASRNNGSDHKEALPCDGS